MTFNVIIENISTAPLVLGISRDPHVAPKTMQPCRVVPPGVHFNVALLVMGKTRLGAPVAIASGFYGSPDVGGTTLVVQPGERVRVQLPAEVRPGPFMEPTLTTDPQSVRIKAFVMIESESLQAAYSDNVLTIELSHPLDASLVWDNGAKEGLESPMRWRKHGESRVELENCRVAAIDDAKDVYDVQDRLCAFYDALTPERQREADAIIVSWLAFREDTRTEHFIVDVRCDTALCLVTSLGIATAVPALFALANRFAKNPDPGSAQRAEMLTRIATKMSAHRGLRFSIFPERMKPATEDS